MKRKRNRVFKHLLIHSYSTLLMTQMLSRQLLNLISSPVGFHFHYLKLQMVSLQQVVSRTNTWCLQSMWGSSFDLPEMMFQHVTNTRKNKIKIPALHSDGSDRFMLLGNGIRKLPSSYGNLHWLMYHSTWACKHAISLSK